MIRSVQRAPGPQPGAGARNMPPMPNEYLTFRLGAEEYGIDILRVQEIHSYDRPMRIANAADDVMGVVNLRGVIVPVVDLRIKLGCEAGYGDLTVVIVLVVAERVIGAVVDSVQEVVRLRAQDIQPPPEVSLGDDQRVITGLGTFGQDDDKRMLILLDIDRLLLPAAQAA